MRHPEQLIEQRILIIFVILIYVFLAREIVDTKELLYIYTHGQI